MPCQDKISCLGCQILPLENTQFKIGMQDKTLIYTYLELMNKAIRKYSTSNYN